MTKTFRNPIGTAYGRAIIVMVLLSCGVAVQAFADTVTLPVVARLVRTADLTVNATLDFGDLAFAVDQAGAVRIDPATNMLVREGKNGLQGVGGKPQAGKIMISGAEYPVQLSMEQSSVRLSNGTDFVTVSDFHFINAQTGDSVTIMPDPHGGDVSLSVGATLRTRVGQTSGSYVGVNSIYAHYQ